MILIFKDGTTREMEWNQEIQTLLVPIPTKPIEGWKTVGKQCWALNPPTIEYKTFDYAANVNNILIYKER
jgi:hypothetical protein